MSAPAIDARQLQAVLAEHLDMYRTRVPHYQAEMLSSLAELWQGKPARLLDIGGGTGVIAEAISRFLPVGKVRSIDLVDRYCKGLSVETQAYDGKTIPFGDGSHDAATMNNVLHHVPKAARADLLKEIRRVVAGPLYIKDHLSSGWLDDQKLTLLDAIGNIPFGGMIAAQYLPQQEWEHLAAASGWKIGATATDRRYRSGPMALFFPNRLEVTFRLDPV